MKMLLILVFVSIFLASCDEQIESFDLVENLTVRAPDADFYVTYYFTTAGYECDFKVIFPVNGKWWIVPDKPAECTVWMWQKVLSNPLISDWVCITNKKDSKSGKGLYYNIPAEAGTTYLFKFGDNNEYCTHQKVFFYKKSLDAPEYGILNKNDTLIVPKIKFDLSNSELN